MKVAVVGAGKMGLPLAARLASRGAEVVACDRDPARVAAIGRGECPIAEPGVAELLRTAVDDGNLRATTDTVAAVRACEAAVVIVPAKLAEGREPDLSVLDAVTRQIAEAIHEGLLVSYETTVPVGTTRKRFLPRLARGGRAVGRDFFLAFSPERVKSGQVLSRLAETPKIVGGADQESARRAAAFYGRYLGAPVENVGSLEAAELAKLAGMVYRDVNIALANELARYAEALGLDLTRLIGPINDDGEAALLAPGIGVGGHCTPVYPYFLIDDARARGAPVGLAEAAREINDGQAAHAVRGLERALGPLAGREVLILGLGFRPGVKEHTASTAFLLRRELDERGAEVSLHDGLYRPEEIAAQGFHPGGLDGERAPAAIVLATGHPEYLDLDFGRLARRGLEAVVDGRNLWEPEAVRRHGILYLGIGRPR